jgi:hypothetical protein
LVESHIDSSEPNAILYLQNDDNIVGSRESGLFTHEEIHSELVTDDNQEDIENQSPSEYHTAQSSRYSDYHSAE